MNGRIFGKMEQIVEQIIDHIKLEVRHRLASLKKVVSLCIDHGVYLTRFLIFDSMFLFFIS